MSSESRREQLLAMLEDIAEALGDDLHEVVFVGGIAASFHVASVRMTEDVDCMVDMTMPAYYRFGERLRSKGFSEEPQGNVICRWRLQRASGVITLDVVPTQGNVLGFSTRWYQEAFASSETVTLPSGRVARLITPLHLVATKIEAFKDRGEKDFLASHDLEDMVAVLAAWPDVRDRIARGQEPVCVAIRGELVAMREELAESLLGHLATEDESVVEQLTAWLLAL